MLGSHGSASPLGAFTCSPLGAFFVSEALPDMILTLIGFDSRRITNCLCYRNEQSARYKNFSDIDGDHALSFIDQIYDWQSPHYTNLYRFRSQANISCHEMDEWRFSESCESSATITWNVGRKYGLEVYLHTDFSLAYVGTYGQQVSTVSVGSSLNDFTPNTTSCSGQWLQSTHYSGGILPVSTYYENNIVPNSFGSGIYGADEGYWPSAYEFGTQVKYTLNWTP